MHINSAGQAILIILILLNGLSGLQRARIEKRSHDYKQFLRRARRPRTRQSPALARLAGLNQKGKGEE
jgi:hypothetical protein